MVYCVRDSRVELSRLPSSDIVPVPNFFQMSVNEIDEEEEEQLLDEPAEPARTNAEDSMQDQ
jgi:hypothetical protein